jgi:tRNA1Val (adenine37-N6)-methyltransferase
MRNRRDCDGTTRPCGAEETIERVGDLAIAQPADGHRYGLDPFLLASFVLPRPRERILDIGTGVGIIPLLLARRCRTADVTGVEIQPRLARLARENISRNALSARCRIVEGDIRVEAAHLAVHPFDRVVSNPPFRSPLSGRVSPDGSRALARQEIALSLEELCTTAGALLREGGLFSFIHLPERLAEVFKALVSASLEPKEMRCVHSFADAPPQFVLLTGRRYGRPGIRHLSPLVLYNRDGSHRSEASSLLYRLGAG